MQNVFFTNTAEKHSTAIYDAEFIQAYMFHRSCRSHCDVEPFFKIIVCCQFRTVNSFSLGLQDSEIQISKCEIPRPALFFRARDSETPV